MKPIVISRKNHALISAPDLTQEQQDLLWEHLVQAYLNTHSEVLTADSRNTSENTKEPEDK